MQISECTPAVFVSITLNLINDLFLHIIQLWFWFPVLQDNLCWEVAYRLHALVLMKLTVWSRCTAKINEPITAAPAGGAGISAQQRNHKVAELLRVPRLRAFTWYLSHLLQTPVVALHFQPSAVISSSDPLKNQGASRLLSKMLACTEMITMCLQSAKQKHLRAQQQQQPLRTAGQGLNIFHDVSGSTPLLKHHREKWH